MTGPLFNLKKAMKKNVFQDFSFSEERKNAVKETIRRKHSQQQLHVWQEKTIIAVLELLQLQSKHGYDISTQLFQKQEFSFQGEEGQLYTLLHLLESKKMITSEWINERKYYTLALKGKKCVTGYYTESSKSFLELKQLMEEFAYEFKSY